MATANVREWWFEAQFTPRVFFPVGESALFRLGDALVAHFPRMHDAVYEDKDQAVSFRQSEGNLQRVLRFNARSVSYLLLGAERADEWKLFNTTVYGILSDHMGLFDSKWNIREARQTVVIPIRNVSDPGKRLYGALGWIDFFRALTESAHCQEIGVDHEFDLRPADTEAMRLILRLQTKGPTASRLPGDQIWISFSVVLDPTPETVQNMAQNWERAQNLLLDWLATHIHPKVIAPLLERLG